MNLLFPAVWSTALALSILEPSMTRRHAKTPAGDNGKLPGHILAWYDRHRRSLPWRAPPGKRADPYRVWLSEIMLQQTTVATVGPYFRDFLARWPTVNDLARAELDEVLHAWQGLGYYARARNLHKCARAVSVDHGGRFPDTEEGLLSLPGIGRYTAAAIAAIAFGRQATAMDGNVERVMARLHDIDTPLPAAKPELYELAAALTPAERPGDYAQAVMDLGATICTPRKPRCLLCPWEGQCVARKRGIAETLPRRSPRAARPRKHAVVFWLSRPDGSILLQRRPEEGLLGGLMEVPSTPWREDPWTVDEAVKSAPARAQWRSLEGVVRHGFTHFDIEMMVVAGQSTGKAMPKGVWSQVDRLSDHALPTLMKKVVRHALAKL
jgi:A/G-specific adenine glycosylase